MMTPRLQRFVDWLVPATLPSGGGDRPARVVVTLGWSLVAFAPVFAGLYGLLGSTHASLAVAVGGVFGALALVALRATRNVALVGHLLTGTLAVVLVVASVFIGGNAAPAMTWCSLVPLVAFVTVGRRAAVGWALAMVGAVAMNAALAAFGLTDQELTPRGLAISNAAALAGLVGLVLWSVLVLDGARTEAISALERAGRELAQARDAAEAGNRAKAAFMETMSHELRTPLVGVLGSIYALDDSPLGAAQQEAVTTAQRSGERLLDTLDVILDVASFDRDVLKLDSHPFVLLDTVESAVVRHAEDGHAKGLEIVVSAPRQAAQPVRGDERRFRQVVASLVENAVKFTKKGEILVRLAVAIDEAVGSLDATVTVTDTGIGMGPALVGRLFQPFTQGDTSATRRFGGTGLGLALARQLARAMGGDLTVESAAGAGTTVTFTARFARLPGRAVAPLPQRSGRVLVVDPSPHARDALAVQLAGLGLEVDLCGASGEGVLKVATGRYAAVLIDESVSLERLRERVRMAPGGPALLVMTHPGRPGSPSSPPEGVDALLRKPARAASLGRVLDAAAARRVATGPAEVLGRLLVLDAHPVMRSVAVRIGMHLGYATEAAQTGAEAALRLAATDYAGLVVGGRPQELASALAAARRRRVRVVGAGTSEGVDVDVRLPLPLSPEALRVALVPTAEATAEDVDRDALRSLTTLEDDDSDAFTRELIGDFLRQTPEALQSMETAAGKESWDDVRRLAHSLKSMSGWVGARALSGAAEALERTAASGDAAPIHLGIEAVRERFERARAGLTQVLLETP